MKKIFIILFPFLLFISCNNNEYLNEYKLLYTDLENLYTNGYKSYYSSELNKATSIINAKQGSLQHTNISTDFAIMGKGFFKIRLDNDNIGYTRNGNLKINSEGELVTRNELSLFEPIILPELFLPDTINIKKDGYIFCSVPNSKGKLTELKVGKLNFYMPPVELLEYYEDGIYILNENTDNEVLIEDSVIIHKFLEMSNFPLLPVFLRMYYILSKSNNISISNVEFKKELLKIIIDYLINSERYNIEEYNRRNWLLETSFIPFLRYDY